MKQGWHLPFKKQALPIDQDIGGQGNDAQASGQFIVSDSSSPGPAQMNKTQFLDRLNSEVCTAANEALEGSPFSADSCPYIRSAFARHRNSSPAQIEQLLNRYEPRTIGAAKCI